MKIKLFLLLASMVFISVDAFSQDYDSAVGIRFGSPNSVSYKTFLTEKAAVEVFGGVTFNSAYNRLSAGAAYLIHNHIDKVEGLHWYYGGGVSVHRFSYDDVLGISIPGYTGVGINGYLGLEYNFDSTPISISLDWGPVLIFGDGTGTGFGGDNGALAIRYILGR